MNKETVLKDANIPEDKWEECYVSNEGMVFTPQKDNEGNIIMTAEEYYNIVSNPSVVVSTLTLEERVAMLENLQLQQQGVI